MPAPRGSSSGEQGGNGHLFHQDRSEEGFDSGAEQFEVHQHSSPPSSTQPFQPSRESIPRLQSSVNVHSSNSSVEQLMAVHETSWSSFPDQSVLHHHVGQLQPMNAIRGSSQVLMSPPMHGLQHEEYSGNAADIDLKLDLQTQRLPNYGSSRAYPQPRTFLQAVELASLRSLTEQDFPSTAVQPQMASQRPVPRPDTPSPLEGRTSNVSERAEPNLAHSHILGTHSLPMASFMTLHTDGRGAAFIGNTVSSANLPLPATDPIPPSPSDSVMSRSLTSSSVYSLRPTDSCKHSPITPGSLHGYFVSPSSMDSSRTSMSIDDNFALSSVSGGLSRTSSINSGAGRGQMHKIRGAKTRLSISDRKLICQRHAENPCQKQEVLARDFGVERSTVSKILKCKDKWLTAPEEELSAADQCKMGGSVSSGRRHAKWPLLEQQLADWMQHQRRQGVNVTDNMIRAKGMELAPLLYGDRANFRGSQGWVEKFKSRTAFTGVEHPTAYDVQSTQLPDTGADSGPPVRCMHNSQRMQNPLYSAHSQPVTSASEEQDDPFDAYTSGAVEQASFTKSSSGLAELTAAVATSDQQTPTSASKRQYGTMVRSDQRCATPQENFSPTSEIGYSLESHYLLGSPCIESFKRRRGLAGSAVSQDRQSAEGQRGYRQQHHTTTAINAAEDQHGSEADVFASFPVGSITTPQRWPPSSLLPKSSSRRCSGDKTRDPSPSSSGPRDTSPLAPDATVWDPQDRAAARQQLASVRSMRSGRRSQAGAEEGSPGAQPYLLLDEGLNSGASLLCPRSSQLNDGRPLGWNDDRLTSQTESRVPLRSLGQLQSDAPTSSHVHGLDVSWIHYPYPSRVTDHAPSDSMLSHTDIGSQPSGVRQVPDDTGSVNKVPSASVSLVQARKSLTELVHHFNQAGSDGTIRHRFNVLLCYLSQKDTELMMPLANSSSRHFLSMDSLYSSLQTTIAQLREGSGQQDAEPEAEVDE